MDKQYTHLLQSHVNSVCVWRVVVQVCENGVIELNMFDEFRVSVLWPFFFRLKPRRLPTKTN